MKALALSLTALAIAAPAAGADGLPLPVDGSDNATVANRDGPVRYGAVTTGRKTTVLKIAANGGQIVNSRGVSGTFGVPIVAYDGTAGGLSADGTTLALIEPREGFPRETTSFRIVDTGSLRTREEIELQGDFSFDAVSPDGARLYLVHYKSPRDPLDYEVQAYDIERGKLSNPIVDPDEPGERMAGFPVARQTSPDGRWAYTLYSGGHETFIHALDTTGLTAQCIDLEDVNPTDISLLNLNLEPASGELTVMDRGTPVAIVDPETFEVSDPPPVPVAESTAEPEAEHTPWAAWATIGGGLVLVGGLGVLLWRRRRRPGPAVDEEALERLVKVDSEEREDAEVMR